MKRDQLLDAIGGIDEAFLHESEQSAVRGKKTLWRIGLVAAIVAVLGITAAASSGIFSRPIKDSDLVFDQTAAPFDMDAQGNIIPGGVEGLKVTMEVDLNSEVPECLEEIYHMEAPGQWQTYGGYGAPHNRYWLWGWFQDWYQEGKPGRIRLSQEIATSYRAGDHCVDSLLRLSQKDGVTTQTVCMADLEMLKVTIPELPWYDEGDGHLYCADGETRLYWTDGEYILKLTYPNWVSDAEAEAMLKSLTKEPYIEIAPEDYGIVDADKIKKLNPLFEITAENGTSMANIVMGQGMFAYANGRIYYGGSGCIYAIDPKSGEVTTHVLSNKYSHPYYLFATENYIGYVPEYDTLEILPLDGKGTERMVYQGISSTHLYADGMQLYTNSGTEMLQRIDLQTGSVTELLSDVNTYYVDDTYIYATCVGAENVFLRSRKDVIDFEKIPLSFYPIKVLADGEDLYFCEGGEGRSYQLLHYRDGVETRLPFRAYDYQILDGHVIYRDPDTSGALKSYDLQTGETKLLHDRMFDFSILEGRYICMLCFGGDVQVYDWQTDTYLETAIDD